jgi:hypothetical protein
MRCYNGCPDSALQAHLDSQAETRRKIVALGYTVTWFPSGEFYQAFKDYRVASSEHKTLGGVLSELQPVV